MPPHGNDGDGPADDRDPRGARAARFLPANGATDATDALCGEDTSSTSSSSGSSSSSASDSDGDHRGDAAGSQAAVDVVDVPAVPAAEGADADARAKRLFLDQCAAVAPVPPPARRAGRDSSNGASDSSSDSANDASPTGVSGAAVTEDRVEFSPPQMLSETVADAPSSSGLTPNSRRGRQDANGSASTPGAHAVAGFTSLRRQVARSFVPASSPSPSDASDDGAGRPNIGLVVVPPATHHTVHSALTTFTAASGDASAGAVTSSSSASHASYLERFFGRFGALTPPLTGRRRHDPPPPLPPRATEPGGAQEYAEAPSFFLPPGAYQIRELGSAAEFSRRSSFATMGTSSSAFDALEGVEEAAVQPSSGGHDPYGDMHYNFVQASAVLDDGIIVDARLVPEAVEDAAEMTGPNAALAAEEKRRIRRTRWSAGLALAVAIVAAAAVAIAVTATAGGRNDASGDSREEDLTGQGGLAEESGWAGSDGGIMKHDAEDITTTTADTEATILDGPDPMPALADIVVGGESLDSHRLDALEWLSRDRITLSLLQSDDMDRLERE